MRFILLLSCLALTGCSFNVSMAHTQGKATDVIDDNMSNAPNISPTITPGTLG